jgi:type I restriction enzyme, S subunit
MNLGAWPKVKLADHVDLLTGFPFKSAEFTSRPDDIPLVKGENVQQGSIDWGKAKRWRRDQVDGLEKYWLKPGDVILAMDRPWIEAGLKQARISRNDKPALLVQRVSRLRGTNGLRTDYLGHLISSQPFTDYIKPIATGINVPHISGAQIKAFAFRIPPIAIQRRIASILSAYDDLIENNTRRIAILEDMARRIYEEWFVRFRFPGHEGVRMVESEQGLVPVGWQSGLLGDVIELPYGKALKAENRSDGTIPVYGSSGVVGYHASSLVDGPGIVVGRKGNVGSVHWSDVPFYPIDTVFYVRTTLPLHFVFFNLKTQNFLNNDAAVPGLNRNQAYSLPVLIPDEKLLTEFEEICNSTLGLARLLMRKNTNLRTTRDLLLPKLISGELDVSTMPSPESIAA